MTGKGRHMAASGSISAGGLGPDRHPTADFFVCDIFDASPKDDLGTMEHPIFSLSTRPDRRVLSYEHNGVSVEVTPSVKGRATIHDKDVLIFCVSQLMAALNAGRAISRSLQIKAHDLLVATNRDTGGDAYARLRESFERLAGTRITTNIETGGVETTRGFGLIEAWEIVRRSRGGRMISVSVTLSEWLYRAVLAKSVLTLSRDYFRLRKPLERRVYELARKHCGRQAGWTVTVATLHKKAGSAAPVRVFRAALRKMAGWTDPHLTRVQAHLAQPLTLDPERPEYHRATLRWSHDLNDGAGGFMAASTGSQASSRLLSMRTANALLELPERAGTLPAGAVVDALLIGDL